MRRYHHRLNEIAQLDLDFAVGVLQFGDSHDGLTLAAHVDERHLQADRDDPALNELALIEALGLDRSLEHRGKVFPLITHGILLCMIALRPPALIPSRAHKPTPGDCTSRIESQEEGTQQPASSNHADSSAAFGIAEAKPPMPQGVSVRLKPVHSWRTNRTRW